MSEEIGFRKNQSVRVWALPVFWAILIFVASSFPGVDKGPDAKEYVVRKIAHLLEFGILMWLLIRAFRETKPEWSVVTVLGWSFVVTALYGASDELHQLFVPYRGPSFRDVIIDAIGAFFAGYIWYKRKMSTSTLKTTLVVVAGLFLIGCGPQAKLKQAKSMEKKGGDNIYKAWQAYQEIQATDPQSPVAPEALFRAGLISQQDFGDCYMAAMFYDSVVNQYPEAQPWSLWAAHQKNNCPDFFPLIVGSSWTEVDSDTKGENARIETFCQEIAPSHASAGPSMPSKEGRLIRSYFAGDKLFQTVEITYKKDKGDLQEIKFENQPLPHIIMKWPLEIGDKWISKNDNKTFHFEIVSFTSKVTVKAGDFEGCLLVRSYVEGDSNTKNEYYAPAVGRVLTTVASKSGEKRITELAAYHIPSAPLFEIKTDPK